MRFFKYFWVDEKARFQLGKKSPGILIAIKTLTPRSSPSAVLGLSSIRSMLTNNSQNFRDVQSNTYSLGIGQKFKR